MERQAHALAKALRAAGVDVTVVTGRWFRGTDRRESIEGVPVVRNHTLWEFFGIRGLRKFGGYLYIVTLWLHLVRHRRDYDVFHVHGLNYHTYATVKASRFVGIPVLAKLANSGEASDIDKMREDRQLALARFMLSTALDCHRFVALNPSVASELEAVGVDPERIIPIPNGVDTAQMAPRSSYDTDGPIEVLFVGRLHPQKDLETLLRAAKKIERQLPGVMRVSLVGDGPAGDDLIALAAGLGVGNVVSFDGATDDVAVRLQRADVFVLPSRAEGLSNALLEAMTAGLPAVVSNIPGNRDVITDEHDGLLFSVGDVDGLASQLMRLVGDTSLRRRLGTEARRTVEATYGLTQVRDRYISLYHEMMAETGAEVVHGR